MKIKKTQSTSKSKTSTNETSSIRHWNGLIHDVPGFRTASLHCGLKTAQEQPPDMALVFCENAVTAAGVFTRNRVCAAPVTLCRNHLKKSKQRMRALIINAGNANACTGDQGILDARRMAEWVATGFSANSVSKNKTLESSAVKPVKPEEVFVFSTGIIGRKLPMDKVQSGIERAVECVKKKKSTGDFARGIMTTDLVPKTAAVYFEYEGKTCHVSGACKGSGMIAPNMATMLGVVVTDVAIAPAVFQSTLSKIADDTFNCVTVDGDTSTNDSLVALASGLAGNPEIKKSEGPLYECFYVAMNTVLDSLSRQIAADGEGATHTITLYVGGTKNDKEAKTIAKAIAESPLVKTAIAGCDPNWGRIMAAAGRSGVAFDPKDAILTVSGHELFRAGEPTAFDKPTVAKSLKIRDVSIVLLVGEGPGRAKFYTCDFTHEYISINADYHT